MLGKASSSDKAGAELPLLGEGGSRHHHREAGDEHRRRPIDARTRGIWTVLIGIPKHLLNEVSSFAE